MKLKNKFLGLLSLLKIRDSATVKAVTDGEQSFNGIKTLTDMASSPNSGDDLEKMPATEVLTHEALNGYLAELQEPKGFEVIVDPDIEDAVVVVPISSNPKPGIYYVNLGYEHMGRAIAIPPISGEHKYIRHSTIIPLVRL